MVTTVVFSIELCSTFTAMSSRTLLSDRVHLKVDHKCLESFEMWCCRKMEKISWTDRVVERNILRTVKRRLTGLVAPCVRNAF